MKLGKKAEREIEGQYKDNLESFYINLRSFHEKQGITQEQLGGLLNVQQAVLSQLLNRKRKPTLKQYWRFEALREFLL